MFVLWPSISTCLFSRDFILCKFLCLLHLSRVILKMVYIFIICGQKHFILQALISHTELRLEVQWNGIEKDTGKTANTKRISIKNGIFIECLNVFEFRSGICTMYMLLSELFNGPFNIFFSNWLSIRSIPLKAFNQKNDFNVIELH